MAVQNVSLPITGENLKNKLNEIIAEFASTVEEFGGDGRIKFDTVNKHFHFEVKQPDGSWLTKAEIGASLIIDTVKFEESTEKPTVKPNEVGLFSKLVTVPDSYGSSTTHQALRPFMILNNGAEVPLVGVWQNELRIPMDNGSNEYAAFKSEITPAKIVGYINQQLGNQNWQSGGGTSSPDTAAQIRDKLTSLQGDDRLSIFAIKDNIYEEDELSIIADFQITSSNYLDYRFRSLLMEKAGTSDQEITLPSIADSKGAARFRIINNRGDGLKVNVVPFGGDRLAGNNMISLDNGDSLFVEKPQRGRRWIVLSRSRDNIIMDGGSANG